MPQPVGSINPSAAFAARAAAGTQRRHADLARERLARGDHAVARHDDGAGCEAVGANVVHAAL
jgi:hypothetical protein